MPNEYLNRIKPYLEGIKPLEPIQTGVTPDFKPDSEIKSIVFDIYGTLIISASGDLDKSNVTNQGISIALKESGFLWKNNDETQYAGLLLNEFHNTVKKHHAKLIAQGHSYPEVDIILVWQQVIDIAVKNGWVIAYENTDLHTLTIVFEILSNAVWPMPKMNAVLQKLFKSKIPIGIVSNAQFYTPIVMNYFIDKEISDKGFINGFDKEISVFSYKLLRSKPDTYLFEELTKGLKIKYKLQPNEVLFVGNDMLKDVWTAKQLGFKTALFAGDKRSLRMRTNDERINKLKADYTITSLDQLLQIVNVG